MKLVVTFLMLLATALPLQAGEITIFAPSSMQDVLNELTESYAKSHRGVSFNKVYAASGALVKQLEKGDEADVVITDSTEWMEYLSANKKVDAKSVVFLAFNQLVFVGKPEVKAAKMQDVTVLGKIAIAGPPVDSAGEYATIAFRKSGIDRQIQTRLVMLDDVRAALQAADKGGVDGAFVYKTDVKAAKNVKLLFTVPRELYPRITYPVAMTPVGVKNKDVSAFTTYLYSNDVKKLLKKYDFDLK